MFERAQQINKPTPIWLTVVVVALALGGVVTLIVKLLHHKAGVIVLLIGSALTLSACVARPASVIEKIALAPSQENGNYVAASLTIHGLDTTSTRVEKSRFAVEADRRSQAISAVKTVGVAEARSNPCMGWSCSNAGFVPYLNGAGVWVTNPVPQFYSSPGSSQYGGGTGGRP